MSSFRTLDNADLKNKRVLLRIDLNVPMENGKVTEIEIVPEDAGVSRSTIAALKGGDANHNADAIRQVLAGRRDAFRDIVILNSAAALMVAGKAKDLKDGAAVAAESIDSGKARKALESLQRICA